MREALGSDAIILANRRVGDRVEIIATGQIDDEAIAVASAMEAGTASAVRDGKGVLPVVESGRRSAGAGDAPDALTSEDDDGNQVVLSAAALAGQRAAAAETVPGATGATTRAGASGGSEPGTG